MILVQHPVSTQIEDAEEQIKVSLEVIKSLKIRTIVIYPNADAGGRRMIKSIEKYKRLPFISVFESLPHRDYLGLLNIASALIGNSSSGIIEAPSFKLPVVNIGIRQKGRERSANIIDVPHQRKAISKAIKKALTDKMFLRQVKKSTNPYGDGHASERIVKVISSIKLNNDLLQKQINY